MGGRADPLKTASGEDVGAETLRRYRYQAAYAAWLAISALNGIPEAVAVYCEHHDDVLLELDDARCDAIQVKSQADGAGPLKATDDSVLKSLRRFAVLEHEFGEKFRRYRLACISGFYRARKTGGNLGHCLEQANACAPGSTPGTPLSTLMGRINAPPLISQETLLSALRKVQLDESLPKLEDMETRVREAIENLADAGEAIVQATWSTQPRQSSISLFMQVRQPKQVARLNMSHTCRILPRTRLRRLSRKSASCSMTFAR